MISISFIEIATRKRNEFPLQAICLSPIDWVCYNINKLKPVLIGYRFFRRHIRPSTAVQVALFNRSSTFAKESSNKASNEVEDAPIKYFGSQAASWSARQSHRNPNYGDELWYQPLVISGSLAVFMIYFCILREENDVDAKLSMSLYDRIDGLEEHQLEASLQYNKSRGLSTLELEKRLKELRTNNTKIE